MKDDAIRRNFHNPPKDFRMINGYGGHWGEKGLEAHESLGFGGVLYHMQHEGYLTDEGHWEKLRDLLEDAQKRGMSVWIYDEDGFPSGPGGGQTLQGYPEGEARGLYYSFAFVERGGSASLKMPRGTPLYIKAAPVSDGRLELTNAIDISGAVSGETLHWGPADQALDWGTPDRDRWVVMIFSEDVMYERTFAAFSKLKPPYRMINLMDEKAVGEFIRLTHGRYFSRFEEYFGGVVPAFFTDEPCLLVFQDEQMPTSAVSWHQEFPEWFSDKYGYDVMDWLPALYHDCGPETRKVRCDYFELVAEKVESSFHKQLAEWCEEHGVASSGHLLLEERLVWHAKFQGDYMRCLRHMQRPGIDVLSSKSQLTRPHENLLGGALLLGAKFCSSVKHHYRRERTMSETSNYQQGLKKLSTSYEDVRATLSWQYAMGIDTIISFYGKGPFEASRWNDLNDYVGRLGLMLTGGRHVCDVAVFYPIKSQWANIVRQKNELAEESCELQERLDADFVELSMTLLEGQWDFDYIHQNEVLSASIRDGRLQVADEAYRVLILPPMDTEDPAVLRRAAQFAGQGGLVISVGRLPEHSADGKDEVMRDAVGELSASGDSGFRHAGDFEEMVSVLQRSVEPDLKLVPPTKQLLALHRRKDGREIFFVFNNSDEPWKGRISVKAGGNAEIWYPLDGTIRSAGVAQKDGRRLVDLSLEGYAGGFVIFSEGKPTRRN